MCVVIAAFSYSFVECVAVGAIVDFVGEGRGSHCWGCPKNSVVFQDPSKEYSSSWNLLGVSKVGKIGASFWRQEAPRGTHGERRQF